METWEHVAYNTDRLRVPGGWLYRSAAWDPDTDTAISYAMCFVPDETETETETDTIADLKAQVERMKDQFRRIDRQCEMNGAPVNHPLRELAAVGAGGCLNATEQEGE